MQTARHNLIRDRRAFTLLELLVVIGILSVLVALVVTVLGNAIDTANRTATGVLIAKLDKQVQQLVKNFKASVKEDQTRIATSSPAQNLRTAKSAYRVVFPQNASDVTLFLNHWGNYPAQKRPSSYHLFEKWAMSPDMGGNQPSVADSSELLYIALTEASVAGTAAVESGDFNASELADSDGDGFEELVDAWGNPLRFYRWPTRLVNPLGFQAVRLAGDAMASPSGTIETIDVDTSSFPDPAQVAYSLAVGPELMRVIMRGSTTQVERGYKSTTPQAHPTGALAKLAPFSDLAQIGLGFVNSSVMIQDPDDQQGVLSQLSRPPAAPDFVNLLDVAYPPGTPNGKVADFEWMFHTLDSYHTPLIVSAGTDEVLGLLEPDDVGTPSDPHFGNLAMPDTRDAGGTYMMDFSRITDPGNSDLADNLTNYSTGVGN